MKSDPKKLTIETYIHAYNSFDLSQMLDCLTDDCVFENVSNSSGSLTCQGKEEIRKLAEQSRAFFTSREQKVRNWILGDHKAALEIDYSATLAQDLPNGLKAGQSLNLRGISVFEFTGDKISRLADYS